MKRYILVGVVLISGLYVATDDANSVSNSLLAPFAYAKNIASDAANYMWETITKSADSTRTLNITIARFRDVVKASYATALQYTTYESKKQNFNSAPESDDPRIAELYNDHKNKMGAQAQVRLSTEPCQEEVEFVKHRLEHAHKNLLKHFQHDTFTHKALEEGVSPRIAVCCSGGGFRAMLSTAGFFKGLEKIDLLDSVTFAAVLSGSTWFTIPRALGQSTDTLLAGYKKYAKSSIVGASKGISSQERAVIRTNLLRKFFWDQPLDGMDLYGALVAHVVLGPFDDVSLMQHDHYEQHGFAPLVENRQRVLYSQGKFALENNNCHWFPLPIATAVASVEQRLITHNQKTTASNMLWFEFTPYEVGTEYHAHDGKKKGAFVPTWAMGRRFVPVLSDTAGIVDTVKYNIGLSVPAQGYYSQDNAPEYPLGNLLGTWGSAFTVSPADVVRILGIGNKESSLKEIDSKNLAGKMSLYERITGKIVSLMLNYLLVGAPALIGTFKGARIFPSTIHNFMQNVPDSPLTGRTLTLVDAGVDYNLPIASLLRRGVKIIIMMDASGDNLAFDKKGNRSFKQLLLAEQWAYIQGIPFPKIAGCDAYKKAIEVDADGHVVQAVTIFEGPGAPTIIYIPLADNEFSKKAGFSVSTCLKEECGTLNFNYSDATIDGLSGHLNDTVVGSKDLIFEVIKKHIYKAAGPLDGLSGQVKDTAA